MMPETGSAMDWSKMAHVFTTVAQSRLTTPKPKASRATTKYAPG